MIVKERSFGINRVYNISGDIPVYKPDLRYACIVFPYAKMLEHKPGLAHMYEHLMLKYGERNGMNNHLILLECNVSFTGIKISYWVRSTMEEAEKFVIDMAFNPEFRRQDIEVEKSVLRDELNEEDDDREDDVSVPKFVEYILGFPSGINLREKERDIDDITLDDLLVLRERLRSTFHFMIFEYGGQGTTTINLKEDFTRGRVCGEMKSIKDGFYLPKVPVADRLYNKDGKESEVCMMWRRDEISSGSEDFIKFYAINEMFHYINKYICVKFSILQSLRNKGICYSMISEITYGFGRFADIIHVDSSEVEDCMTIKKSIFDHLDNIIANGVDRNEFGYAVDSFKAFLSDGSFEGYMNHISHCIENGIPDDMQVLGYIKRFSDDELADMYTDHIKKYYSDKDVNIQGVSI